MKNYTITVNGNVYEVQVEENGAVAAAAPVAAAPAAPKAAPAAPKAAPKAAPAAGAQGSVKVNAPMPGKILKIAVNAGQAVKKGELLIVFEAMKMENEIVAPQDGTVASINVAVGGMVESGDLMATLN